MPHMSRRIIGRRRLLRGLLGICLAVVAIALLPGSAAAYVGDSQAHVVVDGSGDLTEEAQDWITSFDGDDAESWEGAGTGAMGDVARFKREVFLRYVLPPAGRVLPLDPGYDSEREYCDELIPEGCMYYQRDDTDIPTYQQLGSWWGPSNWGVYQEEPQQYDGIDVDLFDAFLARFNAGGYTAGPVIGSSDIPSCGSTEAAEVGPHWLSLGTYNCNFYGTHVTERGVVYASAQDGLTLRAQENSEVADTCAPLGNQCWERPEDWVDQIADWLAESGNARIRDELAHRLAPDLVDDPYHSGFAPSDLSGGCPVIARNMVKTFYADPVNCATGNLTESFTDLQIAGLGALKLTRTYNAQEAANAAAPGPFGYGWTSSFRDSLEELPAYDGVAVHHADGSTAWFHRNENGSYSAQDLVQSKLVKNEDDSFTYTLPDQSELSFDSDGRLESVSDHNGNETTLDYTGDDLTTITAASGREITLDYNENGTVSEATDPAGHTVEYDYTDGELTSVTDVGEGVTHFGYDGSHRLTSLTDPRGKETTNEYDSHNRVTEQTDPLERTTSWDWSTPNETQITTPSGNVITEHFDNYLPTSITKADGSAVEATWSYDYDSDFNPTKVTDPNDNEWTYDYDEFGNRTSATDPLDHETTWTYDSKRNVTSVTTPAGKETEFDYDAHGNLTSIDRTLTETNDHQTTALDYDGDGQLTQLTDPLDRDWTFAYNAYGDRTGVTSPLANQATATYDDNGRQATLISARGNEQGADPQDFTTTITRDQFGNPTDVEDPLGHHTLLAYDDNQNLTDLTDRDERETQISYDDAGQQTAVERGDGATLATSYTADGQVETQTDGLENATSYDYDAQGRLSSITDPLERTLDFGYDDAGNRTSVTEDEETTTYAYDDANRLTSIDYSTDNPDAVSFSYNADGQRTEMSDESGTTTYAHDSLGRLTSTTSGSDQQTTYGYDLADELTSIGYPDALTPNDLNDPGQDEIEEGTVTRTYDDEGNLASVSDWLDNTTSFDYDADGNLTDVTRPNETEASYDYDANGALTGLTDLGDETAYARSAESLLSSLTPPGQSAKSFAYDGARRLTAAGSTEYDYDAADNLTQAATPGGQVISQSFDDANELTTATQGNDTTSFDYDARGNRTAADGPGSDDASFSYDQANQLIGYEGPNRGQGSGSASEQYAYDGDGLRQTKTTNDIRRNEVYDRSGPLPLMIEDGPTAYITGPDGLPIEQVTENGDVRFFSHDQLGSTTALTDEQGDTVASYEYDAYGNLTSSAPAVVNPFRYAGQFTDTATGLQYLRARYYEPATGELLSRDPLAFDTRQPYSYAGNSPTNYSDPSGLSFADGWGDYIKRAGQDALSDVGSGLDDARRAPGRALGWAGDRVSDAWDAFYDLDDRNPLCDNWEPGGELHEGEPPVAPPFPDLQNPVPVEPSRPVVPIAPRPVPVPGLGL